MPPLVASLPSSAGPLLIHNHHEPNGVYPPHSPSPESEQQYNEKATMLAYRRPSQPHPLAHLSSRELFKAIHDHAAVCKLPECRLDNSTCPSVLFLYQLLTYLALTFS